MRSALLIMALGALLAPQQSRDTVGQPQARDTVGAPPVGTGVISGQVFDEASNRPLRRATVTINGDNTVRRSTITDDDGRFAFKALAPGHYTTSATKPAYVQVFYGARRAGRGPGTAINLVAGQQLSTVQLKLPHGSAITGRIVDMNGRPQPNVRVQISERRLVNGERKLVPVSGSPGVASTDDRGVYRAFGLPAGEYVVLARPMFGGPGDLRMTSADEVQWAQQQLQQKNSAAGTIGAASTAAPPPPAAQPVAFAPVFYPGTTDIANAAPVSISAGDERSGIDFALLLVPTATISGVILGPDGRPSLANVTLLNSAITGGMSSSSLSTNAKGAFSFSGQSPGQYRLVAKGTGAPAGAGGGGAGQADTFVRMVGRGGDMVAPPVEFGPPPRPGTPSMWAIADVSVSGVDITDIGLTLQPGASMSGKVAFKGAGAPADPTKIRIYMSADAFGLSTVSALANADGTFKLEGLGPGKYRVTSTGAASPWFLKSALVEGADVLDDSLEVKPGADLSEMTLVFDDRPSELSGKLIDAKGAPASGYSMIAFSTNKATWTIQGTRRTKSARPATDGKYVISGLPAGEYFLAAVTDFDQTDLSDAAFLEEIAAGSLKITIGEGEKKTQDLRLARTP